MKNNFKFALFIATAILSLSACGGTKGPGEIGSRNDIAVINKGIDGAKMPQPFSKDGDFTTTTEQVEAVPAAQVEEVPTTDMPVESEPQIAAEEQTQQTEIYPAQTNVDSVAEPETQIQAVVEAPIVETPAQPAPIETPTPVKSVPYPLDPNAPYSPTAIAKAQEAAAAVAQTASLVPVTEPTLSKAGINLNDPVIVRSVQAKLSANALYTGTQTGVVDAALLNAIVQYQSQNKLPVGGLNEETLKHLGIIE